MCITSYKQNFYHDNQNIMDKLFHQYHVHQLKYIDNHTLITKSNIYILIFLHMKKNLNKEIKLPSNKKEIYCCDNMTYWETNVKEFINWFFFTNIMEYTSERIDNDITSLPSLLEKNVCFRYVFVMIRNLMIKMM